MKSLFDFLEKFIYGYTLDCSQESLDDKIVAAGDPKKKLGISFSDVKLTSEEWKLVDGMSEYEVSGFSMFPDGISSEDHIFITKEKELNRGDFVVVSVDKKYYERFHKRVCARRKLRRYIMDVPDNLSLDDVSKRLLPIQPESKLPYYQNCLKEKYDKVKIVYPEEQLCLSYTYKNGEFRYSFHPRRCVEGIVKYCYSRRKQNLYPVTEISC